MDSDKIFDEAQEKLASPQEIAKRKLPPVIHTLDELHEAAQQRLSISWPPHSPSRFLTAGFVLNMPGGYLRKHLEHGLQIYSPNTKWKKKPEKWQRVDIKKKGKTLVEVFKEEEERNANQTNP
jgi:hypothetical protein